MTSTTMTMEPSRDEELRIDRAERRRRFEAEALVHLDALFGFALKLSRAREEAEDLVGETVLRAFERWEQYRLGSNIRAWLFTILYHAFVSRRRRHAARELPFAEPSERWGTRPDQTQGSLSGGYPGGLGAYPGGSRQPGGLAVWSTGGTAGGAAVGEVVGEAVGEADPEGAFYASFLDAEVERALAGLPADYRAAVVLSDLEGLRYAEIATVLGIPEGTVKSRLFRGRRRLQTQLRRYATEMGIVRPGVPEPVG